MVTSVRGVCWMSQAQWEWVKEWGRVCFWQREMYEGGE